MAQSGGVLRGLFAEFEPFNQRWADRDRQFIEGVAALRPGLSPVPRLDVIRSHAERAVVLNNSQLSAISVMAGFAREHREAWRLAVTQLRQSYQLHLFHLAEVERAEKRNSKARKTLLEDWSMLLASPPEAGGVAPQPPKPAPTAPADSADDEPRVSTKVARVLDLWAAAESARPIDQQFTPSDSQVIDEVLNTLPSAAAEHDLLSDFLSEWNRLLRQQARKDQEGARAAEEEFRDLVENQRKQLEIR